ncbi:MAG: transposase [Candidatus Electronema sp. V4]|uniref:transposase n=1 Tax=Candidatus Electronema sp. V4 TaxID=3454756 RepID=UPI0040559668
MAGKFEGNFSRKRRNKPGNACGLSAGKVLNSLLFILATGCRQCDLPRWASKSSRRRRLKAWHLDGALNALKAMIIGIAGTRRMICWNYEDDDGSFPHEKGGGSGIKYGCKGEVVLIHLIADSEVMPLSVCSTPVDADERKQVKPLLDGIEIETGRVGRSAKKMRRLAADKGYDSEELRKNLSGKGIHPQIQRKKNASARRGKPVMMTSPRFKVERTFSWLQKNSAAWLSAGKFCRNASIRSSSSASLSFRCND